jgi:uncharacterized repeat protein (TIGR03806 family)
MRVVSSVLSLCGLLALQACVDPQAGDPDPIPKQTYCDEEGEGVNVDATQEPCEKLSSYRFFAGTGITQEPNEGVVAYDMNTSLYSDYASKHRFIYVPEGKQAKYSEDGVLEFPVGTVILKTFGYLDDMRNPGAGEEIIETRLLMHRPEGWVGYPYIWNAAKTDAVLTIEGGSVEATWIHSDGTAKTHQYMVPNGNDCKACHKGVDGMAPIGPKARNLNREFAYADGDENQLERLARLGKLAGLPDLADVPQVSKWDDETSGTLEERARAYLDNNCAHCHNPKGPARTSGLDLDYNQADPGKYGICKAPVAAGGGSLGLQYDIVPGKPEESILVGRMSSLKPDEAMPEVFRAIIHEEGVQLITDWIAAMPATDCTKP